MIVPVDVIGPRNQYDFQFYSERFDGPLGRVRIDKDDDPSAVHIMWIWNVHVHVPYRRLGLGRQMVSECIEFVINEHPEVSEVRLAVFNNNHMARKLYITLGFRTIIKGTLERFMRLELRKP